MSDPQKSRLIGYLLLFAGIIPMGIGAAAIGSGKLIAVIIGIILLSAGSFSAVYSVFWMYKKVRCPHCNALLPLKLYPIGTCPYCGKKT